MCQFGYFKSVDRNIAKAPQRRHYFIKKCRHEEFKKALRNHWVENGRVCSKHIYVDHEKVFEGETVIVPNVLQGNGIYQTSLPIHRLSQDTLRKVKNVEANVLSPGKIYSPSTRLAVGKTLEKMIVDSARIDLFSNTGTINNNSSIATPTKYIPKVTPGQTDSEIHRRTGFFSEKQMLAFIVIVCNGDIETIARTNTTLTWYEEWFFYFEWMSHKSVSRWIDAEAVWNKCHKRLNVVFLEKLKIVRKCQELWPDYASFEEDKDLRHRYWDGKLIFFSDIFHPSRNIEARSPPRKMQSLATSTRFFNPIDRIVCTGLKHV